MRLEGAIASRQLVAPNDIVAGGPGSGRRASGAFLGQIATDKGERADAASREANTTGKQFDNYRASTLHDAAAQAHSDAAKAFQKEGNKKMEIYHDNKYELHSDKSANHLAGPYKGTK